MWAGTKEKEREGGVFACYVSVFPSSLFLLSSPPFTSRHEMEGNEEPQTPERSQGIKVGDLVHVYNGTSSGTRAYRTMAYLGTVVGFDEIAKKWLVCVVLYLVLSCLVLLVCHSCIVLSCTGSQHDVG